MSSLFQAVGGCRMPMDALPGEFAAAFIFPPEFRGFAGHFPGSPVLPGIAQIMAVLHACAGEVPLSLQAVTTCKFLHPVEPGERVVVTGKKTETAEGVRIAATVRVEDAVCATMTLLAKEVSGL